MGENETKALRSCFFWAISGIENEQRDQGFENSPVALPLTIGAANQNIFMYKVVYMSPGVCMCGQKSLLFLSLS